MPKKLSDLYELHIHNNNYHAVDYITKDYVNVELKNLTWQSKVLNFHNFNVDGEPDSPSIRDRYIATETGGEWIKDYIYEWNGETWISIEPKKGFILFVDSLNRNYIYYNDQWDIIEKIITHNDLKDVQGSAEGYHLQQTAYDNLKNQDQSLETTNDVTFDDITITNPSNVYTSLNHDDFNDYDARDHRQWEESITQDIHDDNITSSSVTQHEGDITHNNLSGLDGGGTTYYYHLKQTAYNNLNDQNQKTYTTSSPSFQNVTINNEPVSSDHAVRKDYVDSLVQEGLFWKPSVVAFYDASTGLPSDPETGDRYIASESGNGWTKDYIYQWDGTEWLEIVPENGFTALVRSEDRLYTYMDNEWVPLASFFRHNYTTGIQGGNDTERYHLQLSAYDNLKEQDQSLKTTDDTTFNDITITNPSSIYSLSHNSFADYDSDRHIDWTVTGPQQVHADRLNEVDALPNQTGHNGKFLSTDGTEASWQELQQGDNYTINDTDWVSDSGVYSYTIEHNQDINYPLVMCWNTSTNKAVSPFDIESIDANTTKIYMSSNDINMNVRIL